MSTQPLDTPQDPTPDQDPTRRTERPERPVRFRATLDVIPAYKPGKPPAPVEGVTSYKMSSNENPYPPLPSVLQAAADALTSMNRYPDPSIHDLTQRLLGRGVVDAPVCGVDDADLGHAALEVERSCIAVEERHIHFPAAAFVVGVAVEGDLDLPVALGNGRITDRLVENRDRHKLALELHPFLMRNQLGLGIVLNVHVVHCQLRRAACDDPLH